MERLRILIAQHGRWGVLVDYIDRIEAYYDSDFSTSIENAKALLESIGKEICIAKKQELRSDASVNAVLKAAFCALGYSNENIVNQVSGSLANIGQRLGNLRSEISPTSHGRPLDELRERNNKVDLLTREFLVDSTVVVAVFLIRAFEERNGTSIATSNIQILYSEAEDFNEYWDDEYGEFLMQDYSYTASEILYNVDYKAYEAEYRAYQASIEEEGE